MFKVTAADLLVANLGTRSVESPLELSTEPDDGLGDFVSDDTRILYQIERRMGQPPGEELTLEKAGPRQRLFFNPRTTRAAIVTCGGLCPGLNNVIRSIVLQLHHNYHVTDVLGIRYGYHGFDSAAIAPPIPLTLELVEDIHRQGGSILGSSRGPEETARIAEYLRRERINLLFCIGGDGTQRGAHAIAEDVRRRGLPVAVVGVPKTIDNDLQFVARTFGFATALEKARDVVDAAHVEAKGAPNGLGLVKLMGREAGFIAAGATLASQEANYTLIPEVAFPLEGEQGFLAVLKRRMLARSHAVVVVAEGAGQNLIPREHAEYDASGNRKLQDIGVFLRDRISAYFKEEKVPLNMKYFDPSYLIRSVPANSDDALLCDTMGRYAVHAAMAGKTDILVGLWHGTFVHVPISAAVAVPKRLSPESELWLSVLESTGQPRWGSTCRRRSCPADTTA